MDFHLKTGFVADWPVFQNTYTMYLFIDILNSCFDMIDWYTGQQIEGCHVSDI